MRNRPAPKADGSSGWTVYHSSNTLRPGRVPDVRSGVEQPYGPGAYFYWNREDAESERREVHVLWLSHAAQLAPWQLWVEADRDCWSKFGGNTASQRRAGAQRYLKALGYDGVAGPLGQDGEVMLVVWREGLIRLSPMNRRAA